MRDRRTGLPSCQRPAGKLPQKRRIHYCRPHMCGGRRIRQHGLSPVCSTSSIFGGGSLAEQAAACAPEACRVLSRSYFGDSAAQDVQERAVPILSADGNLPSRPLSWLMRCRQQHSASRRRTRRRCSVRQRRSKAQACAAEVLGRMTRLCYRHQNVRYSAEISRAKVYPRKVCGQRYFALHMVAAEVGFSRTIFPPCFRRRPVRPLSNI